MFQNQNRNTFQCILKSSQSCCLQLLLKGFSTLKSAKGQYAKLGKFGKKKSWASRQWDIKKITGKLFRIWCNFGYFLSTNLTSFDEFILI